MIVHVQTDAKIAGGEAVEAMVQEVVETSLSRFRERLTRVEVHLTEETGHEHKRDDKRCLMEARLEGHQPLVVTQHSSTTTEAVDAAAEKLGRLLDHTMGRLQQAR